ncbi:Uncharacterized protein PHSC3_001167 [Chlamydiales bacterium STE3]|nr:Uncharacterized protein PHSC3_001167 [Chlamydiales bacterium STE3]
MRPLSLNTALSKEGTFNFPFTAAFDNYFSFSGRRYRVIETCTVNGKKGYRVEEQQEKQNIPLNILKVISFATVIIPLIMGVGKLICRSRYRFYPSVSTGNTGATQAASTILFPKAAEGTTPLSGHKKISSKVLPVSEKDRGARADLMQAFKKNALDTWRLGQMSCQESDFTLTKEEEASLIDADKQKYNKILPKGLKVFRGVNTVLLLDSIPRFVFKAMQDRADAEHYIELVDQAQQIIFENHLFLLSVPSTKMIEVNGNLFIIQEKADLISASYDGQEGVYSYCWHDNEMGGYRKTLFSQLITFIAQMGFSDVKYDNIPLTKCGRAALIDLDTDSSLQGFTVGGAGKNDGLFNYIPSEYLDEFLEVAKEKLTEEVYKQLEKEIQSNIKKRAKKKERKREEYLKFAEKNGIKYPFQKLNSNLLKIFNDKKILEFAQATIECINQHLSGSMNFDVRTGRKIELDASIDRLLHKKSQAIWGKTLPFTNFLPQDSFTFLSILSTVLKELKEAGYIYKYKEIRARRTFIISC